MGEISQENENNFIFRMKVLYNQMIHIPVMLNTLKIEFPHFFEIETTNLIHLPMSLQEQIDSSILIDINKPTRGYCSKFIKMLTQTLERLDKEVNESILEKFLEIISPQQENEDDKTEYCWKSYYVKDKWITLKNENAYNLVGMTTWGAAYQLSDFILSNQNLFINQKILELGSGTGLVGIILDFIKPLKKLILTDYSPKVLKNLKVNMELNNIEIEDLINDDEKVNDVNKDDNNKINQVRVLDWEIEDLNILNNYSGLNDSNIILGADIVYEPSLCKYLVSILYFLLERNDNSVAYISSTIRNQSTFSIFQKELNDKNLTVIDITKQFEQSSPNSPFIYDRSQIVLYKIYLEKK
ncbi:hypothetical protein RB653_002877 [Dictyostelium firmibasis]|uniref:Uncharacterized protein n=1 Tax=Dictyostelium firmibasis TaxID=79012 RepID=A0AAN7TR92_9MYCE